ncbi:hypothetical protein Tco_0572627 [Tanacetum coccineum]
MSNTRSEYGSGVARPKIDANAQFELKGKFLKELHDNTFSGSEHEDVSKHIEKVLEIVDLFNISNITQDQLMLHILNWSRKPLAQKRTSWFDHNMGSLKNEEVILFYNGLDVPTRQILDSKGAIPTKTVADAKVAIHKMVDYSQKWHNGTSSRNRNEQSIARKRIRKSAQLYGNKPKRPRKSISTAKANLSEIRRMGSGPYVVSIPQHRSIFSEIVPFPRILQDYSCDDWREARGVKILKAYDHTLPEN